MTTEDSTNSTDSTNIELKAIVINTCFGGFGISDEALAMMNDLASPGQVYDCCYWLERDDPILVKVVEELGDKANATSGAKLKVVRIPNDVEWELGEYDGIEHIAELHRTWR